MSDLLRASVFPSTLLVGANGPIGRAVSRLSGVHDLPVVATSRSGSLAVDVSIPAQVEAILRSVRPEALVYLVRAPRGASDRQIDTAVEQMLRVASLAVQAGVSRFVLASSAAVYGDRHRAPRRESDPTEGVSAYATEKITAERQLEEFALDRGLSAASARIFNVFGPGCRDSLLNALVEGPPPVLAVTPHFVRDYVHVDDVASALLLAAQRDDVIGAVNIGSGRGVDNSQLAAACPDRYMDGDASIRSFSVADPAYAKASLAWQPREDPFEYVSLRRPRV